MSKPVPIQVLIVDDVEEMLLILQQCLSQSQGLVVSGTAKNGAEARVELFRRKPDLVLLDEILPGESSVDLIEEFRAEGVQILLMTGVEKPTHSIPKGVLGRVGKPGWDDLEEDGKVLEKAILSAYASR